jgi:hypothetical protein
MKWQSDIVYFMVHIFTFHSSHSLFSIHHRHSPSQIVSNKTNKTSIKTPQTTTTTTTTTNKQQQQQTNNDDDIPSHHRTTKLLQVPTHHHHQRLTRRRHHVAEAVAAVASQVHHHLQLPVAAVIPTRSIRRNPV